MTSNSPPGGTTPERGPRGAGARSAAPGPVTAAPGAVTADPGARTAVHRPARAAATAPTRRPLDPEERFQRTVTIGFVALIAVVVVIVVAAFIYNYWDTNFRPVASVGGTDITDPQWRARAELEAFRLDREEGRVRTALAAGTMDEDEAAESLNAISVARQQLGVGSLERLIDLTLRSQLAADQGITLTVEELEAALEADGSQPERRRVQAVIIDPTEVATGPDPTPEDRQKAFEEAQAALAAIRAGSPFEEVVASYSTDASKDQGGDIGLMAKTDQDDPAWTDAIFALEPGEVTPLLVGDDGVYRIGKLTEIVPPEPDPSYREAVEREVGADVNRDNVRLETLADRLEAKVIADAVSRPVPQVRLAEILIEGDPFADPEEDEGTVHASHILYSPDDDPSAALELSEDDPAWEEARVQAAAAATALRAIADIEARREAFAERARTGSDDGAGAAYGGDLGYFSRDAMVPEFADPLFDDPDLVAGDVLDPVRSPFGWHVIQFHDRKAPIADRLDELTARLAAEGADFAAIATEASDGAEASAGGELGWRLVDRLDPDAALAIGVLEVGDVSEPVAQDDGYHIYRLLEKTDRPLDPSQAAMVAASAFGEWYDEQRVAAEDSGRLTRDPLAFDIGG